MITGLAWDTPLGRDLDAVWERLCAGDSGLAPVDSPHPLRNNLAAVIDAVPYGTPPGKRQRLLATRALAAAFADAGLPTADPEAGLVLGTSFGASLDEAEPTLHAWADDAAADIGHPGTPVCVMTACSAGSDAIALAHTLVRAGRHRVCVAGGVDVVTEAKRLGHSALGTMSPTGLRAFDRARDGMLLGEGAAFVVVEHPDSARERGARVYARLRGAGAANDAAGLTAPDPSGRAVVRAVERCLASADLAPADVAVVNAHGTGTPLNDEVEARSLLELFGDDGPLMFATKGAFGHSLGATGAIEAVATVLALRDRRVPPVIGLSDPVAPLRLATGSAQPVGVGAGLSLTLGFGGFNTCLLFEGVRE
ncbi:beta-ketoacyl synthase N-terminal-like domain-containing protein [Streptomyces pinistramenti]|uniref:beta-ketoacyl synthase N-terminal-like domain-containing protein n=1 Tax=Streptomyces pinistramenti TaxID=2884812 RepID=UPI001D093959|nr:beta-ketoacyl synthase N-terminal-like domain-containing protein [Streptomyces pinistramenti]MCB5907488.1 beta-ketoacyl-[acyl-carrier-protein] synthase family protein [Streptomyces pinistramenti]